MKRDLPIYEALVTDAETGIYALALVTDPAVESLLLCFDEDKKQIQFKVENEEKRVVTGLIMCADRLIYRRDDSGYEYYIKYSKDTLQIMAEKMLFDGVQNVFNFGHDSNNPVYGMLCREIYLKDVERNINPKGFEDVEDGSLFGTFYVSDDEVWNKIKDGTFGISLEGYFSIGEVKAETPEEMAENALIDEILGMLDEIKNKVK